MRFLILLMITSLFAVEVPDWVMRGILKKETRSYYQNNEIVYIDQRVGSAGELGPFQMKLIAFNQIRHKGERFSDIRTNKKFAEECAIRYLTWIYNHSGKHDWKLTVQKYHTGPRGRSYSYLLAVLSASN